MLPVLNLLAEVWTFYQKLLPVSIELILKVFCESLTSAAYLYAHSPKLSAPTEKQSSDLSLRISSLTFQANERTHCLAPSLDTQVQAAPLLALTGLPEYQILWSAQLRSYLRVIAHSLYSLCASLIVMGFPAPLENRSFGSTH